MTIAARSGRPLLSRLTTPLMLILLGVAVSAAVRLWFAVMDLATLDRLFLPDDTYYVLSIARNIAAGFGPSADGIELTSGFQPLIALILTPAFLAGGDPDVPVRIAILTSGIFGALNTGLAGAIVHDLTGRRLAAAFAMAFAATSPVILGNDMNGMETSLASFCLLLATLLFARARCDSRPAVFIAAGLASGLAMLARIDSCFLVGLLGLWGLGRFGPRQNALIVGAALATVAPWWGYSLATFGGILPESGAALRQIVEFHRELHLSAGAVLRGGADAVSFLGVPATRVQGAAVLAVLAFCASDNLVRAAVLRRVDAATVLIVAGLALFLFYTLYLPANWFFERYFNLVYLSLVVAAAVSGAEFLQRAGSRLVGPRWLPPAIAAAALTLNVAGLAGLEQRAEAGGFARFSGVTGYRQVAQEIMARLPEAAVVGAMQSGALAYYARPDVTVVNLDGVVSARARRAIAAARLGELVTGRGVDHFADWTLNLRMLARFWGPGWDIERLGLMAVLPPQSAHSFHLYRLSPGG